MRVAYLYFMKPEPARIGPVVPQHVAYWHDLRICGYEGGPFADRSGGLITFEAESLAEATELAARDPFAVEGLVAERWVKEWRPEAAVAPALA